MKQYQIIGEERGIKCLLCGAVSWNIYDVRNRYCGACHKWLGELRCDFCDGEYPLFKDYKAIATFVGKMPDGRTMEDGDHLWGACETCTGLIEGKKWGELLDRCVGGHECRWTVYAATPEAARRAMRFIWTAVLGFDLSGVPERDRDVRRPNCRMLPPK